MHFLILLAIQIALSIISAILFRPKAPKASPITPPTTDPSTPIPVLFGRGLLGGNVIAFLGYRPIAIHVSSLFGLVVSTVGYNYQASMVVALCLGEVTKLLDIVADTGQRLSQIQNTSSSYSVSGDSVSGWTTTYTRANAVAIAGPQQLPYDVPTGAVLGDLAGDAAITLNAPHLYGSRTAGGGVIGPMHFFPGSRNQPVSSYWSAFPLPSIPGVSYSVDALGLVTVSVFFRRDIQSIRYAVSTSAPPSSATVSGGTLISAAPWTFQYSSLTNPQTLYVGVLGYDGIGTPSPLASFSIVFAGSAISGQPFATGAAGSTVTPPNYPNLCYVVYENTILSQSPYPRPLSFELARTPLGWVTSFPSDTAGDVNPVGILYELMTDRLWGIGLDDSELDLAVSWAAASDALCNVSGTDLFFLSYVIDQQASAYQYIDEIFRTIDAVPFADPLTGKYGIQLIRGDYTLGTLPVYDESNIVDCDYTQAVAQETVNEVKVTFSDAARLYQPNQVKAQNLASILAMGRTISVTNTYKGVTTEALALRLAQRDLRALSTPLSKATLTVNRQGFDLHEGSPFKLSWARAGVSAQVMRVAKISRPGRNDSQLTIECVQDVFALPGSTTAFATSGVAWDNPSKGGSPAVPEVVATQSKTATIGYAALQVNDPDSRITKVQFQHQSGRGTLTNFVTASSPYKDSVTLDAKYSSLINWVVTYAGEDGTLDTITGTVTFDVEQQASSIRLTPLLNAAGQLEVRVESTGSDTVSSKIVAQLTTVPTDANIRAGSTQAVPGVWNSGVVIPQGVTLNVAAFGYDSTGTESVRADLRVVGGDASPETALPATWFDTFECGAPTDLTDPARGWSKAGDTGTAADWIAAGGPSGTPFGCAAQWGTSVTFSSVSSASQGSALSKVFGGFTAGSAVRVQVLAHVDNTSCDSVFAQLGTVATGLSAVKQSGVGVTGAPWVTLETTLIADGSGNVTVELSHGGQSIRKPPGTLIISYAVFFDNLRLFQASTGVDITGQTCDLVFEFGDGVTAPAVNSIAGALELDFGATITRATIVGDVSGAAAVDIQTATFVNPPVFTSIAGSALPTLSTETAVRDNTLTGWTTTLASGVLIRAVLNSLTTCKKVTVTLTLTRT